MAPIVGPSLTWTHYAQAELSPKYIKTSRGLILPREIYYALTNIKGIEKEISKPRHILGIEHGNIPIQLDLWGNEVIFRGKGQTTLYGYPRYKT